MLTVNELKHLTNENRKRIVTMVYKAGVGHVGGSLSVIDFLTAIYELEIDFTQKDRSRLVLSKGHATPALYAELIQKGAIDESEMDGFRNVNSRLQGHPNSREIKEIDATTGLLGQGVSMAAGMAIVKKNQGSNEKVYVIAGDGELQEGQIWEAIMFAAHKKLDNLVIIVDYNKLSSSHDTNTVINLEPLRDKFEAFNCKVFDIDGHNMQQIVDILSECKQVVGQPSVVISHTVKGKGVSYMENQGAWHSKGLTDEEYKQAIQELEGKDLS